MSIFLDSVNINQISEAVKCGFISGVTTNPLLLSEVKKDPKEIIYTICSMTNGKVFYQITSKEPEKFLNEAFEFSSISPEKIVLKIPCTYENLKQAYKFASIIPCAATAVYSPAQALLALESGFSYIIPYVNRATRFLGDGIELVKSISSIIKRRDKKAILLAASLKTEQECIESIIAGADAITIPFELIVKMSEHKLTQTAIAEFDKAKQLIK